MQRWSSSLSCRSGFALAQRRLFSGAAHVEHISVPCASSGSITVSLHNVNSRSMSSPLLVYLPPLSLSPLDGPSQLPPFLQQYPTVSIHYRWPETLKGPSAIVRSSREIHSKHESSSPLYLHWPNPIHDALFGYDWIVQNLSPSALQRRDIYVYGSYLGASLAAALSLTESHTHQPMAVRGFMAFNGIFDWTMFLAEHPINKPSRARSLEIAQVDDEGTAFHYLRHLTPTLFKSPSNLFDPFASPVLFFHTAGLLVPESFTSSSTASPSLMNAIDELSGERNDEPTLETAFKVPRKGYLAFPPRQSSLKIPESLLLYESPPAVPDARRRRKNSQKTGQVDRFSRNSFQTQALELSTVMRRSINKLELKERMKWDSEFDDWDHEAERRAQTQEIGYVASSGLDLNEFGEKIAREWLNERLA